MLFYWHKIITIYSCHVNYYPANEVSISWFGTTLTGHENKSNQRSKWKKKVKETLRYLIFQTQFMYQYYKKLCQKNEMTKNSRKVIIPGIRELYNIIKHYWELNPRRILFVRIPEIRQLYLFIVYRALRNHFKYFI